MVEQGENEGREIGQKAHITKVWGKKGSKFWWKFYLTKSCQIFIKLWYYLCKVFGRNMWKFQQNRTTFYKIKFCSENGSNNIFDTFLKNCEAKKVS